MIRVHISTERGSEIGSGHYVRVGHLSDALQQRGAHVVRNDKGGIAWHDEFDITIIDVMNNDDMRLIASRPRSKVLAVIVGAGHTITRQTHWIADAIIYQTYEPAHTLYKGVPGERIFSGPNHIIIDPRYMEWEAKPVRYPIAVYWGGGISEAWARAFYNALLRYFPRGKMQPILLGNGAWHDTYEVLQQSGMYMGSMGMMVYEAMAAGLRSVVWGRSTDHLQPADLLDENGWAANMGLWQRSLEPAVAAKRAIVAAAKLHKRPLLCNAPDGKGVYRIAQALIDMAG